MKTTTPRLSRRAIAILRKVQKAIIAEPKLYEQDSPYRPNHNCDSPGCICGWLDLFLFPDRKGTRFVGQSGFSEMPDAPHDVAAIKLLGGWEQYNRLFSQLDWPDRYANGLEKLSPVRRARRASRRIDHFIKTGGAE